MTDLLRLAISPDSDDAFMAWALDAGRVDTEGLRFVITAKDVQDLNEDAARGEPPFDISAISFGALPVLADRWSVLTTGSSFGIGTGPKVVSLTPPTNPSDPLAAFEGQDIALPGRNTTAALCFAMAMGEREFNPLYVPFDAIVETVVDGHVAGGVIIHEEGLRFADHALHLLMDLGAWWQESSGGLPLPLGATALRRDLPAEVKQRIQRVMKASIKCGLEHRGEALAYARPASKGLPPELLDQYINDYVNPMSIDFGERGLSALRMLLERAENMGLIPPTLERLEIIMD